MKEPKHFTSSSTGGETLHATRHTDSATIKLKTSSRNHLGKSRTNRFHSPLPFKMWRLSQLKRSNALIRFKILERLNNKSPTTSYSQKKDVFLWRLDLTWFAALLVGIYLVILCSMSNSDMTKELAGQGWWWYYSGHVVTQEWHLVIYSQKCSRISSLERVVCTRSSLAIFRQTIILRYYQSKHGLIFREYIAIFIPSNHIHGNWKHNF